MLNLPITVLQNKYREYAETLRNQINPGILVVYYDPIQGLTANDQNLTDEPTVVNSYGGRTPIDTLNDRFEEEAENVHVSNSTEAIKIRSYWEGTKSDISSYTGEPTIANKPETVKIICHRDHVQKLKNAVRGVIDGRNIKMVRGPVAYGLFEKDYYISYWECTDVN